MFLNVFRAITTCEMCDCNVYEVIQCRVVNTIADDYEYVYICDSCYENKKTYEKRNLNGGIYITRSDFDLLKNQFLFELKEPGE